MRLIKIACLSAGLVSLLATEASAQSLPAVAPDALAARLRVMRIEPGMGFAPTRAATCIPRHPGSDWAWHCVVPMSDRARGGRIAALEIMIFDRSFNFAEHDGKIKAAVGRMPGRWAISYQIHSTLTGQGRSFSLPGTCHQSRGRPNSPAYCLLPVSANVLVFVQAPPAEASSDGVTTSTNGGSDSFDDMAHAGNLATIGATTVAEALFSKSR